MDKTEIKMEFSKQYGTGTFVTEIQIPLALNILKFIPSISVRLNL